jgi:hypothetical protein
MRIRFPLEDVQSEAAAGEAPTAVFYVGILRIAQNDNREVEKAAIVRPYKPPTLCALRQHPKWGL